MAKNSDNASTQSLPRLDVQVTAQVTEDMSDEDVAAWKEKAEVTTNFLRAVLDFHGNRCN